MLNVKQNRPVRDMVARAMVAVILVVFVIVMAAWMLILAVVSVIAPVVGWIITKARELATVNE